jgi:hypothetical protein
MNLSNSYTQYRRAISRGSLAIRAFIEDRADDISLVSRKTREPLRPSPTLFRTEVIITLRVCATCVSPIANAASPLNVDRDFRRADSQTEVKQIPEHL